MRLLLDTHALLWWFAGDTALPPRARQAVAEPDAEILVSAASIWEIATKYRLGRLPGIEPLMRDLSSALAGQGFVALPITIRHAEAAGALPGSHRDPFDRMLIAQAMLEDLTLVSNETLFDTYALRRLWA